MIFTGISKSFSLINEDQYNTIGTFWDEMERLYGLERLRGLGHRWSGNTIEYAIGWKHGNIPGHNFSIVLPDEGWTCVVGETEHLKELYDAIYQAGALTYEMETFDTDGTCKILYYRSDN